MKNKKIYEITLKNSKKMKFWFIGNEFEKILKDYNIPYKIIEKCKR